MKVLFNKSLIILIILSCWVRVQAWEMPFYTGKIIPTPHSVEYYDQMLPLNNVALILKKGIDSKHILVTLLRDRIESHGGKISIIKSLTKNNNYSIVIVLGNETLSSSLLPANVLPSKPQG